jgi:hypothetical protein
LWIIGRSIWIRWFAAVTRKKLVHLTPALSPSNAEREKIKLTAAINRAKDSGDIQTLREIADDPHGFILRQGWARHVR